MLVLNTGDPKSERETVARQILMHCGVALRDAPEEYCATVQDGETFIHIHGCVFDEDTDFDVMVMDDPDPTNDKARPTALALLRIDPEDGALLYSRMIDEQEPTDQALLIRAAMEELMGLNPEDERLEETQ